MKRKTNNFDDILKDLRATVSSPNGTTGLTEANLSKVAALEQLRQALTPYMTKQQEIELKQRILEQMLGDGTGKVEDFFKQEYPGDEPEGRSLEEFLETLK